jgi:hypothetical protein
MSDSYAVNWDWRPASTTGAVMLDTPPATQDGAAEPSAFARTLVRRSQLRDLPPVEPLIEDVMSLRSTVVLVGPTGAGKTFVGLSWACSIGTGHEWLGHPVHQCRVLYTVGEGANGLDDRVTAWEQAWSTKVEDDQVVFSVRPASLVDMETWVQMRQEALALGCRVVMLDTFSSLAPDADETKDAARLLRRMADLAAAIDGSVILVHHPGWGDASRARGGYQLEANADEVLILHGNAQSDLVQIERKKVKEGPAGDKMWLRRRPLYGSVIIESATAADAEVPLRDQVLGILGATGEAGATGPQLIKELGLEDKRSSVYKVLGQLRKDGSIATEGSRGKEKYRLADSDV